MLRDGVVGIAIVEMCLIVSTLTSRNVYFRCEGERTAAASAISAFELSVALYLLL